MMYWSVVVSPPIMYPSEKFKELVSNYVSFPGSCDLASSWTAIYKISKDWLSTADTVDDICYLVDVEMWKLITVLCHSFKF